MDHARILNAYISRIVPAHLNRIVEAEKESWAASMHLGVNSQVKAQANLKKVIGAAVDHMLQHDKDLIEQIISDAFSESDNGK